MTGLYIHIPFCQSICHYCDFYKMVASKEYQTKYIQYLIKNLKLLSVEYSFNDISTIYIGGGTPSILNTELLIVLLSNIHKYVNIDNIVEFTFECNLHDITDEKLAILKRFGVNRISIGIQSLNTKNGLILGRESKLDEVQNSVNLLKKNNINNYSFDLMYAIPNETLESVKKDLEILLSFHPKHLSTYSLILEEHTILDYEIKHHFDYELVDEETDALMYDYIKETMIKNGYLHYETSNFALPGYESKHNLIYWNCDNYIGVGPSSASLYNNKRFTMIDKINLYYQCLDQDIIPYNNLEVMDKKQMMDDFLMLGLRLSSGITEEKFFERFNEGLKTIYPSIDELIKDGSLIENDHHIFIPSKYQYIANHIISKII